jgi:hypothetical protein
MSRVHIESNVIPEDVLSEIIKALSSMQFGSLEIQIHNGAIVQLERREKKRWDKRTGKSGVQLASNN